VIGIDHNQTHIWKLNLDDVFDTYERFASKLNKVEAEKASRFYFEKDRVSYTITHGFLRLLLSDYLSLDPSQVNYQQNPYGKPFLEDESLNAAIKFNLSHSNRGAVIAISKGQELGVDIEFHKSDFPLEEIAKRFFSTWEVGVLMSLPIGQRKRAFFDCWTRKEAFIKAKGEGLSMPLDRFDIEFFPGERARIVRTYDDPSEADRWSLENINTWSNYSAAVCVEGLINQVQEPDSFAFICNKIAIGTL
jgi:4'-phosphopantetheinyl transferase